MRGAGAAPLLADERKLKREKKLPSAKLNKTKKTKETQKIIVHNKKTTNLTKKTKATAQRIADPRTINYPTSNQKDMLVRMGLYPERRRLEAVPDGRSTALWNPQAFEKA